MVKITNGVDTFEVTHGAFKTVFKPQGYYLIYGEPKVSQDVPGEPEHIDEVNEDEAFVESVVEKPIGSWSKAELKRFTDIKGIDISGAKSVADVREVVKNHLA